MTKKEIIDDLFKKRSEYKDSDQAEMTSNLLDTISSDIYSESQRFVFELIQNADDAAKDNNNEVHFEFYNNCLVVSHNGTPFSFDDIKALTSAGSSTKKEDTTKTGYKGIGFKSVFGKSDKVTIISEDFQFRFDRSHFKTTLPWQVIPIWTELGDLPKEVSDIISKSKYSVSTIIEIKNVGSLENDLNELIKDGQILLFLRRVSKISVSKNGKSIHSIEKKTLNADINFNEVTLYKDDKVISSWITKTFENIPVPEKTKEELKKDEKTPKKLKESEFTEISFAAKLEADKIKRLRENESLIFTYLPTKVDDFKFPFLVNGSFLTNAAREAIHEDKVWNQWLFELIAEKTFDWLELLVKTKYQLQILQLLPSRFNLPNNELKKSFDKGFSNNCSTKNFILTENGNVRKPSEVVLDKTGLSAQNFIDQNAIIEFLNTDKNTSFKVDCFVSNQLEAVNRLASVGVEVFELSDFETFFVSESFTSRHQINDNFSLITYFKERSDNDTRGIWFQTLKTLPFIFDENGALYNPSNGICFPIGLNSTELGNIPVIHPEIFEQIQRNDSIYTWLKSLGVKEPSQVVFVTNVIIPNLKDDGFINDSNFLRITHYLLRLYKSNLLEEEVLESLRELKLKTRDVESTFIEAQHCFLSNRYRPQLKIEGIVKNVNFVSEDYLTVHNDELEWNLFFKALKVKDRVEVDTINKNNSLNSLSKITDEDWINKCDAETQEAAKKIGGFGFGSHNVIRSVKLPSFLNLTVENIAYSKIFWQNLISSGINPQDLISNAVFKYGVGYGQNSYGHSVENYFPWFLKNKQCIPTSTGELLSAENVFVNDKEIKQLVGNHLPVFDFDEHLPESWRPLLRFKYKLELNDYLTVLSKIAEYSEAGKDLPKSQLKRIGFIYNMLSSLLPELNSESKSTITAWSMENRLLSGDGSFVKASELFWITIEGFSVKSDKLKTIYLPENCTTNANVFKELMSLLQIQTIDQFIPVYQGEKVDTTLKNKLERILPYYVALIEKKKVEDDSNEFERIYELLDQTTFYSASEIKLALVFESQTFDGPSLQVYNETNRFYFKGKWKSERTQLDLIKELANLLGVFGLNEELRYLLLETEEKEVKEWLEDKGIVLSNLRAYKPFSKQPVVTTNDFPVGIPYEEIAMDDIDEFEEQDIKEVPNSVFNPVSVPRSFNAADITVKTKTYINSVVREPETSYSNIQSQEVREEVGRWCEEFIFDYLTKSGEFEEIVWANEHDESGKPYDFKVKKNGVEKFIDVKGTPSEEKNVIYLSQNEWIFMFEKGKDYSIYRVYGAGETPSIDIVDNPSGLLQEGKIFPNPITLEV